MTSTKPCKMIFGSMKRPTKEIDGKSTALARVVLTKKLGRPIRDGYWALHTCNNGRCIEPEHIYEGTREDNGQDRYKSVTHCVNGHGYSPENTYIYMSKTGLRRRCRICIKRDQLKRQSTRHS